MTIFREDSAKRKTKVAILATTAFFLFSIFLFVAPIIAAPPTSPYAPGETLNPTCAPGSANCTVSTPVSGFSGDGTFASLTTSTVQVGIGATSTFTYVNIIVLSATSEFGYLDKLPAFAKLRRTSKASFLDKLSSELISN